MVIKGEQKSIDDFCYEDFELKNYQCHAAIKAVVAV
jgi:thymidylate synthase